MNKILINILHLKSGFLDSGRPTYIYFLLVPRFSTSVINIKTQALKKSLVFFNPWSRWFKFHHLILNTQMPSTSIKLDQKRHIEIKISVFQFMCSPSSTMCNSITICSIQHNNMTINHFIILMNQATIKKEGRIMTSAPRPSTLKSIMVFTSYHKGDV